MDFSTSTKHPIVNSSVFHWTVASLLSCRRLIRTFLIYRSVLLIAFVVVVWICVCLFVIGPINLVFKQLLQTESVASCRARWLPWRRDDLPLLQLSKSLLDVKPIHFSQTVCRLSTLTSWRVWRVTLCSRQLTVITPPCLQCSWISMVSR